LLFAGRFLMLCDELISVVNADPPVSQILNMHNLTNPMKGNGSWEDAVEYLDRLAELYWHWRSRAGDRYGALIARVKQYVQDHYGDESLSLNEAARHVNVSPSHLSKVFSQETGKTFIDYLMETRIQKAKELLLSTGSKSYEIAFQVGYQDPHYFSNVFKRMTGMTIREFRKRGAAERTAVRKEG